MKVAAYQAPLLAAGSMGALELIRARVRACEAEGVEILCCPEAIRGGLADQIDDPARFAIRIRTGQLDAVLAPLASDVTTTIIGFTELGEDGFLYNAAAVFHRIDRKRKKKGSNDDWTHPHDPDAKITKMKDGRTHLAHKAEQAVDLETGAIVGVTVQDADDGDTETSIETLVEAAEQVEAVRPDGEGIEEVVGDKGYHSNQSLVDLEVVGVRSYISEPDRGRRNWKKNPEARAAVYRNRRRIRGPRGPRGLRLLRLRGERLERPFAHLYETGGMRRVYLRGHTNIRKRVLIHAGGFNLGLLMRQLIGVGTPRGCKGGSSPPWPLSSC